MRRRNDSFSVTEVIDRSLRVLAGRLSTDARACTGVHGRFGRRLAADPVVRTETSSIREEGGIPGVSVPQARQRRGAARVAPAATRGSNLDELGANAGRKPESKFRRENTRHTGRYLRNADAPAAQGSCGHLWGVPRSHGPSQPGVLQQKGCPQKPWPTGIAARRRASPASRRPARCPCRRRRGAIEGRVESRNRAGATARRKCSRR